ncbi:MAG: PEGA domain-containing protein, partial [Myxococcota bacterium]
KPAPKVVIAIAAVIVALLASVTMILVSKNSGPESVPRSGPLIVDSEPRGARVMFEGFGAEKLNDIYGGARTPFTVDGGIPVGPTFEAVFVRDGFAKAKVDVPPVVADEVPPALFAELVPDTEANKAVLSFVSDPPGADIYVGGHKLEKKTPLEEHSVAARQLQRIEFRKEGYLSFVDSHYLEPGQRMVIDASLKPKEPEEPTGEDSTTENGTAVANTTAENPDPDEPTEPALVPEPEIRTRTKSPSPPPRRRPSKGYVRVDAPIPMKVYAGGKLIGQTPLRRESLPTGSVRLRLESPSEGFYLTRRVRIRSGETAELDLALRKGTVALQATPWARVRRGNKAPVQTPTQLTVYEGDYRLRFECPDGSTRTKIAKVTPGKTTGIPVDCRSN